MNLDKNINDIVSIFNAFKENDDFYHELIKEAYTTGKDDEARKITRARDEFKNNYKISKETTELIKENFDKYIKIIDTLNKKEKSNKNEFVTSNDTYNVNINANEISNNDTFTISNNSNTNNNSEEISSNTEEDNQSEIENNLSTEITQANEETTIDNSNYVFSSKIAKENLERKLNEIKMQINAIRKRINSSEKLPSKKEYQQLFQLEAYRDNLIQRIESINLEESYGANDRIAARDKDLSDVKQKINENKVKLKSENRKFVKVAINRRLENLRKKHGRIEERQRSIVNKDLSDYYKKSFKEAKTASRENAVEQYYQDKKDYLEEKRDSILDNIEYNNGLISSVKNKFYKFRSLPTSARISYIEMIQNKEVIMNGFRNLNKEISNKLYNKMQNVTKQTLEQLKVLRGVLKVSYQTPQ